ncbi:hypothetical protein EPO15_11445 [bacterium]|nr:MAG: hypothetical protein EPO15_11445 [bacterium]
MTILLVAVLLGGNARAATFVSLDAAGVQGNAAVAAGSLESASAGAGAAFEGFKAPPAPVRAEEGSAPRKLDFSLAADLPAAQVPTPDPKAVPTPGIGGGIVKGAQEGAMAGFSVVLQPAVLLLSEGYGRQMSRHYDGGRGDNGGGEWYMAAGFVVAAVLYIPALVAAGLGGLGGGVAGGVAEGVSPGSTKGWCGECVLD